MAKNNIFDKFYTHDDIAETFFLDVINMIEHADAAPLVEPSAGGGAFLRAFKKNGFSTFDAYDIAPEADGITKQDFLALDRAYDGSVCVGNPPFGHRSKLAIKFFNKCASFADCIAFVIPVTFDKWSVQSKLDNNFKLILSKRLPDESFNENGQTYSIRCLFQIWVRNNSKLDSGYDDLRLKQSPPTALPNEFKIWQYNATNESRRYVDEDWEWAFYRQGYKDYSKRFVNPDDYDEVRHIVYDTNIQLFFVKPLTNHARKVIQAMNLDELAKTNLSTPGFGKRDFVWYYQMTEKKMMKSDSEK